MSRGKFVLVEWRKELAGSEKHFHEKSIKIFGEISWEIFVFIYQQNL